MFFHNTEIIQLFKYKGSDVLLELAPLPVCKSHEVWAPCGNSVCGTKESVFSLLLLHGCYCSFITNSHTSFLLWRCPQNLSLLKTAERSFKERHPPFRTSEDCLYLNVYSPAGSAKKDKLPVRTPVVQTCAVHSLHLMKAPKSLNCSWKWDAALAKIILLSKIQSPPT